MKEPYLNQMTLQDLRRIKCVIAIRRLAISAGIEPIDIRVRLHRGQPELTPEESKRIYDALNEVGLNYKPR